MSILEFARAIKKYTGTGSAIEHQPLPADDPKVRRPDIGRARKILNWEPQIGFEAGIKKTIDWFAAKK
jgi:dTDP-glucose 4,6-dehydratase